MTQGCLKRRNAPTRIVIANRQIEVACPRRGAENTIRNAARQKVVRAFFSWFTWRQPAFELSQTMSPKRFAIPEFV